LEFVLVETRWERVLFRLDPVHHPRLHRPIQYPYFWKIILTLNARRSNQFAGTGFIKRVANFKVVK